MGDNLNKQPKRVVLSLYFFRKHLIFFLVLALIIVTSFGVCLFIKNKNLEKEQGSFQLSRNSEQEKETFDWSEQKQQLLHIYLSTSISKTLSKDSFKGFTCLNFNDESQYLPFDSIKESLGNKNLKEGLQKIENYIFTKPIIDENSKPLPPLKARYEIQYTNICNLTENRYVVIFLTTQQKKETSYLIHDAIAAGGWIGDAHMALIEGSDVIIYERFPFTANLIKLPKEGKDDVLLRFGAYYWCGSVIANTNKHLVVECSGNMYSFDYKSEQFSELAICGRKLQNGSYMTDKVECYDSSGTPYLSY